METIELYRNLGENMEWFSFRIGENVKINELSDKDVAEFIVDLKTNHGGDYEWVIIFEDVLNKRILCKNL